MSSLIGLGQLCSCHTLEKESCTHNSNISLVFNGSCDPCRGTSCDKDYTCHVESLTRDPNCQCKSTCLDVVEPVCASNGKTYRNQCTMDKVSKYQGGLWRIYFQNQKWYPIQRCEQGDESWYWFCDCLHPHQLFVCCNYVTEKKLSSTSCSSKVKIWVKLQPEQAKEETDWFITLSSIRILLLSKINQSISSFACSG